MRISDRSTAAFAAVMLLSVLAQGTAWAGTYGYHGERFPGYTIGINLSIGAYAGPNPGPREGKALIRATKTAKETVVAIRPQVEKMVRHYRRGRHPYGGLRGWIDLRPRTAKDHALPTASLRLGPLHRHLGAWTGFPPRLELHLKPGIAEHHSLQRRIVTDFVLAQASPGGLLAEIPDESPKLPDDLFLTGLAWTSQVTFESLLRTRRVRTLLHRLATGAVPMPRELSVPVVVEYTDAQGRRTQVNTNIQHGKPLERFYRDKQPKIVRRDDHFRALMDARNRRLVTIWDRFHRKEAFTENDLTALGKLRADHATRLLRLMIDLTPHARLAGFLRLAQTHAPPVADLQKEVKALEELLTARRERPGQPWRSSKARSP